jgi:hypothetical protein
MHNHFLRQIFTYIYHQIKYRVCLFRMKVHILGFLGVQCALLHSNISTHTLNYVFCVCYDYWLVTCETCEAT